MGVVDGDGVARKLDDDDDDLSSLTSLSDDEDEQEEAESTDEQGDDQEEDEDEAEEEPLPPDFVEWEAVSQSRPSGGSWPMEERELTLRPAYRQICVTVEDWRAFPERFAGSRNANEKALRDYIVDDVLEQVEKDITVCWPEGAAVSCRLSFRLTDLDMLQERQERRRRQRRRQTPSETELSTYRKSSRIAMKESVVVEKRRVQLSRIDLIKRETTASRDAFNRLPEAEKRAIEEESRQFRLKEREEKKREREEREALREAQEAAAEVERAEAEKRKREEAERRKAEAERRKADAERRREEEAKRKKADETTERLRSDERRRRVTGTEQPYNDNKGKGPVRLPRPSSSSAGALESGSDQHDEDEWYLDCEFCGMSGRNLVCCCCSCFPFAHD
jgi:hypothetical protein